MAGDGSSGWSLFTIYIPADRLDVALKNPDALQVAYSVGVLELLSIGVAILGVALVVASLTAFFTINRSAKAAARKIAKRDVPKAVDAHIRMDGFKVIKEVLKDPETLSALSAAMDRLGLIDVTDAGNIEGSLLEALNDAKADRTAGRVYGRSPGSH